MKSESGRSDPPRRRERRKPKEAIMTDPKAFLTMAPPGVEGTLRPQPPPKTNRKPRLFRD
jgi:hypothetical protein